MEVSPAQIREGLNTPIYRWLMQEVKARKEAKIKDLIDHDDEAVRGGIKELEWLETVHLELKEEQS